LPSISIYRLAVLDGASIAIESAMADQLVPAAEIH
jgi:hypothetical protein